jgi:hypothetical protein
LSISKHISFKFADICQIGKEVCYFEEGDTRKRPFSLEPEHTFAAIHQSLRNRAAFGDDKIFALEQRKCHSANQYSFAKPAPAINPAVRVQRVVWFLVVWILFMVHQLVQQRPWRSVWLGGSLTAVGKPMTVGSTGRWSSEDPKGCREIRPRPGNLNRVRNGFGISLRYPRPCAKWRIEDIIELIENPVIYWKIQS